MEIDYIKDAWYRLRVKPLRNRQSWLYFADTEMMSISKEEWARPRKRKDGFGSIVTKIVYCVYTGNVADTSGMMPLRMFSTIKEAQAYVESTRSKKVIGYQITRFNNGEPEIPNGLYSFQIFRSANDAHRWMVMNGISRVHWSIGIVKSGDIENPSYIDIE